MSFSEAVWQRAATFRGDAGEDMTVEEIMANVELMNAKIREATLTRAVECIQYTPENMDAIKAWCGNEMAVAYSNIGCGVTLLAGQSLRSNDWIVRISRKWIVLRNDEFLHSFEVNL